MKQSVVYWGGSVDRRTLTCALNSFQVTRRVAVCARTLEAVANSSRALRPHDLRVGVGRGGVVQHKNACSRASKVGFENAQKGAAGGLGCRRYRVALQEKRAGPGTST